MLLGMATVKARRRTSVPQAKNVMLCATQEILGPSPLDVGPVWDHWLRRVGKRPRPPVMFEMAYMAKRSVVALRR
jgi:hypothetical protein